MILGLTTLSRRARDTLVLVLVLGFTVSGALVAPASAQDVGELARQASTQLRTAERAMFAGKLEEAQQQLAEARKLVEAVKAADPNHSQLANLERKCAKLAADIGRRVGKETPPVVEKGGPPEPDAAKLPGGVSKRLRDVDTSLGRLRGYMAGDSAAAPASRVKTATGYVEKAKAILTEIEDRYGSQVPADHPELVAARERVDAAIVEITAFEARLTAAAAEAAAPKPIEPGSPAEDRAKVEELYERFADALDLIHGNSLVYGVRLEEAQQAREQIEKVEKDVLPTLQPALATLVERYGERAMEIDTKLHELGVPPGERFANHMERLVEGVRNVAKSRAASADQIARNAAMMLDSVDSIAPEYRVKRMQQQKEILLVGQKLDPNHAKINELLADLDERIVAMSEQIERDIDAREWAGPVADFPGPGTIGELTEAALAYFRGDDRWGKHPTRNIEVLAVAIRGPWLVAERDVFGRVIRWRLPIHLAITDAKMREKDVARVYELSLVGLEGAPNDAKKAPPFDGYWVGDSWAMRIARL